jgi:hypothetical protein
MPMYSLAANHLWRLSVEQVENASSGAAPWAALPK